MSHNFAARLEDPGFMTEGLQQLARQLHSRPGGHLLMCTSFAARLEGPGRLHDGLQQFALLALCSYFFSRQVPRQDFWPQ